MAYIGREPSVTGDSALELAIAAGSVPAGTTPAQFFALIEGDSNYLFSVFTRKSGTAPVSPTTNTGSFNFTTSAATAPNTTGSETWSIGIPSGTNPVYVSQVLATIAGSEGTDSTLVWSTPVEIARNGVDGTSITVDTALSATSTNAVQNKVINTALAGKANTSHSHSSSDLPAIALTTVQVAASAAAALALTTEEGDVVVRTDEEKTYMRNNSTAAGFAARFVLLQSPTDAATNIAQGTRTTTTVPVTSSTGTNASLTAATTSLAGVMTSADKTKLDGIAESADVNVVTNIAQGTRTTTTVPVTSSTGTDATLTAATTSLAGVMSSADKTKLDGVDSSADVNNLPDLPNAPTGTTFYHIQVVDSGSGDVATWEVDGAAASPAIVDVSGTPTLVSGITGAEVRSAIGAGTSSIVVGTGSGDALAGNTTIPAPAITDVSGTPTLVSGITGAEVRLAIGAGTSSIVVGTGSGDALAGNTTIPAPAITDVSGTPTLVSGITGAEVRTAIGAGTSSIVVGTGSGDALAGNTTIPAPAITDVSGTPTLVSGITGTEVRTAIGAGTSSLVLGTTAGTALVGSEKAAINLNTAKTTNATHTGDVTGATALTIADNAVNATKLNVVDNGTSGQLLSSDADGSFSWVDAPSGTTNLGYTNSSRILTSSTGTNVTLPVATGSISGLIQLGTGSTDALPGNTTLTNWSGASTGLVATTGRTSLGLGTAATKSFGTAAGNLVELNSSGSIPAGLIDVINLSDVESFTTIVLRNASTATVWHRGDVAIITAGDDLGTYIYTGTDQTTAASTATADWTELQTPTSDVTSVNTRTGAVTVAENATHTGEVTGSGALTIASNIVDEDNLKVSNSPSAGQFLLYKDGTDELTWATGPTRGVGTVTTTTLGAGVSATAAVVESGENANYTFGIPVGATGNTGAVRGVGTVGVTTVAVGGNATAAVTASGNNANYTFGIPTGATGAIRGVGTVGATTVAVGGSATAAVTASGNNANYTFGLPTGATGATGAIRGVGTVTANTVAAGGSATAAVVASGNNANYTFGIPVGADGADGTSGTNGTNGSNGSNGTSATFNLSGTTLTITV